MSVEQEVYQDMKNYIRFMSGPNYVNKLTYKPLYDKIIQNFMTYRSIFTQSKVREMNNKILKELERERERNRGFNMIVKKKLQILLNNYYIFRNPLLQSALMNRNNNLVNEINRLTMGEQDIKSMDEKSMDEAVILILRDTMILSHDRKSYIPNMKMDPRIFNGINGYIKVNFYDKYPEYFTEQKRNELNTRIKNVGDIINVEGYEDVYMIGVM